MSNSTYFGDGPDNFNEMNVLHRRGKRHDYFTACLPWPQKGPGVELPLGETAPVIGNGMSLGFTDGTNNLGSGANTNHLFAFSTGTYGANVGASVTAANGTNKVVGVTEDPAKSGLIADLSEATAATINSLRQAFQI